MSQINVYFPCAACALMGNRRETDYRRFGGTLDLQGEENPQLLIHTERLARYKEDSARGLIFPPPKPRTGFSARHTSKDVGYPQPSSWRFPLITTRSAMASMIGAWKASCSTGLAFVLGMVISSSNNSSVCSRAAC